MKTEEQIKAEVTTQIIDGNREQLNEELKQLETQLEELYRTKIEQDVKDSLEIAETGCTNTSPKTKEQEIKKFQQQLVNIKVEKEAIEKKLHALDEFHNKKML
jgi:hypothetical protein